MSVSEVLICVRLEAGERLAVPAAPAVQAQRAAAAAPPEPIRALGLQRQLAAIRGPGGRASAGPR